MKKRIFDFTTKSLAVLLAAAGMAVSSCSMEPDEENMQPITGVTIEEYLSNDADLSSFNYILQRSGYDRLMATYGTYTCFAPSNAAIDQYLNELWTDEEAGTPHNGMTSLSLEGLTDSLCTDIAEFHLAGTEITQIELSSSSSTFTTMLGRTVMVTSEGEYFVLNDLAKIIYSTENEDKPNNGTVHKLDRVIPRSNRTVLNEMDKVSDGRYSIFVQALELAGFDEVLDKLKKEQTSFEDAQKLASDESGFYYLTDVTECKLGFTVFAESDDVLKRNGINDLSGLIEHANSVYGNAANSGGWYDYFIDQGTQVTTPTSLSDPSVYKDSCNALHMWLAYHIIKASISKDLLTSEVSVWTQNGYSGDSYEYYETMLPKTLMKIWKVRKENKYYINRYVQNNTLTDGLETLGSSSMHPVIREGIVVNTDDILQPLNGYVYSIDGGSSLLEYQSYVPDNVLHERMRMDCWSFLYESMNNGFRGKYRDEIAAMGDGNGTRVRFPNDYFDNIKVYNGRNTTIDMTTRVPSTETSTSWMNYQGDGLQGRSEYDLALKLPPVPEGDYELRIDITTPISAGAGDYFGMTQYYIGSSSDVGTMVAVDLPIDLRVPATDPRIGCTKLYEDGAYTADWEEDKGLESDKVLRTHNWMRGPLSIVMNSSPAITRVQRFNEYAVRRILIKGRFYQRDYWLRMKSVLSGNHKYQIDYVEFCPLDVAESEVYLEDMY